jgi:putative Mn2+ efflux pump MntP
MYAGLAATAILPPAVTNLAGGVILIAIGLYYLIKYFFSRQTVTELEKVEEILPRKIGIKEAFILAIALTINNLGMGIGVGLGGGSFAAILAFTFIFSILFIILGNFIGESVISKILGKYAEIASGIIMILIGVFQTMG